MHTVGDVCTEAREVLRDFDTKFLPDNTQLHAVLGRQEKAILPSLVAIAKSGFEFPGDGSGNVDISTWAESYTLPDGFWRHRHTVVNFDSGAKIPVQVVPGSWEQNIPPVEPAMFLRGPNFYPIDGVTDGLASSRSFGWSDADSVDIRFITEPTEKTSDGDALDAPDEAVAYLAYALARYMATRSKAADSTVQQIRSDQQSAYEALLNDVARYPGAENAPTG